MGFLQGNVVARVKDGGGIEYSTDGGATWTALGGGLPATDLLISEVSAAASLLPSITAWKRIPIGAIPVGTTAAPTASDGAIEGGGIKTGTGVTFLCQSVFQLPKTGPWWIAFVAALKGGGASGHDSEVGLINGAGANVIAVMRRNATSPTKYTVQITASSTFQAGSLTADSNKHRFRLFCDGVSTICYIDGVLDNTVAAVATVDEPMYPMAAAVALGEAVVEDCVIGFSG